MMVKKKKLMKLAEAEAIARVATHDALMQHAPLSDEDKKGLALGKLLTDEAWVFELYVPAEKPQDAKVISRATVSRTTGQVVAMEVFLPRL